MKRTLFLVHRGGIQVPGAIRGTEACVLAFLRHLDRARFDPVILCNNDTHAEVFRAAGVEAHAFDVPEVMIEGTSWRLPLKRYWYALRRLDRFVRERGAGAFYISGGAPCQVVIPIAKRRRVPTILHFHHPSSKRNHQLWLTRFADRVIFPSEYTRSRTLATAGIDGTVVFNGIDCQSLYTPATARNAQWRLRHGIEDDDVVVGQVGAFSPNKRHDILIEGFRRALARRRRLKLVLVGDGPERARMERLVATAGLTEHVIFTGYVPLVADFFRDTLDINVLASDEEGLGLVLLEGAACGLPSIGSDCSGIREAIRHGETGYLFRQNDPESLANHIVDLANHPERRIAMGHAARQWVESRFSEEHYAAAITAVVDETICSECTQ